MLDILFKLSEEPTEKTCRPIGVILSYENILELVCGWVSGLLSIIVMRGPKTIHKHRPGASLTWTQFMISLLLYLKPQNRPSTMQITRSPTLSFTEPLNNFKGCYATESTEEESMKLSMISSNEILNHTVMEFCLVKNARITRNCCRRLSHLAFTFDSNFTNACPRLQSRYQVR